MAAEPLPGSAVPRPAPWEKPGEPEWGTERQKAVSPPDRSGPGLRAALIGGVVGAIVAVLVTGLTVLLLDQTGSSNSQAGSSGGANLTLQQEGLDIQALLAKAQPSVVTIEIGQTFFTDIFGGTGSGVIISEDGLVLTNAHVVAGAEDMTVRTFDGVQRDAVLVGSLPEDDIALIRLQDVSGLEPAELGSSDALLVGDEVVAIGNALNLGGPPSVTRGIVSAKDRTIEAPGITLSNLLQTDAAINPGNSGGPLVNARGEVVGINTAIIAEAQNIGFALAIDPLMPLIEQLRAGGGEITSDTTFLGVSTVDIELLTPAQAEEYDVDLSEVDDGSVVAAVVENSAAEVAGLEVGDVIVSIDGEPVGSPDEIAADIIGHEVGDTVVIEYQRDGRLEETSATLSSRADTED